MWVRQVETGEVAKVGGIVFADKWVRTRTKRRGRWYDTGWRQIPLGVMTASGSIQLYGPGVVAVVKTA